MKGIIGLTVTLIFLITGNCFSQDVSFELSGKKFASYEGKQVYEFEVLISSEKNKRLHSGQLYFNYQNDILGENLISKNAVTSGIGTDDILLAEESGNPLFKGITLNDNTDKRFSFAWQNAFSCAASGDKSIIIAEKKVLVSFRILLPAGVKTDELDLNQLICFESGEVFDDQSYECPGAALNQILSDAYNCSGEDTLAPVSLISPSAPAVVYDGKVTLSWTGTDNSGGSGIAAYDIYMSVNNGPFQLLAPDFADTSYVFTGEAFNKYSFYTIATDNKGNREKQKSKGDVTVFFDVPLDVVANNLGTSVAASPNPMTESFTLRLGEVIDQVEVRVTNIYGETMFEKMYSRAESETISFQGASGVYFVKVISGNEKSALFKIVKL
jgi:hypothetical protein